VSVFVKPTTHLDAWYPYWSKNEHTVFVRRTNMDWRDIVEHGPIVDAIFFRAVSPSIRDGSATTVNDAISTLFDSFRVRQQTITFRNRFSPASRTHSTPNAT
jgi:hypothetical protein